MQKIPLSVVVLAKNEEVNIASCLMSVHDWAEELIVVDDESRDQTLAIVKNYTNLIFERKMENEGRQRNWAYAKAKNEWVLSLDADETLTDELKEEISQTLKNPSADAYAIPQRNYIGNYWVRHSGWYPASKVKLFRKDKFRYEEVQVHPRVFVDGKTGALTKDIIHKGYPSFEYYVTKLNRQTTWEAQKWIATGQHMTRGRIIRRSVDRFFRTFIGKQGYKDGFIGFMIAFFGSLYQVISYAKYWEMRNQSKTEG
jgi:glycosyltransferase involved in cell wall biosynthesis